MTLLEHFAATLKATEAACGLKPLVKARFEGIQPWPDDLAEPMELYTLEEDIPGHPKGSTVSSTTIRAAGYALPNVRKEDP